MKTKRLLTTLLGVFTATAIYAQIGYQVVVMDQTKGEPKANASVAVSVTLTDNTGKIICSESGTHTTDNFGIISLQIGNSSTFENMDWSKLPLWITASVDGVTVSKTQVLSVPVAEHAKHTGSLTKEILCGKRWKYENVSNDAYASIRFNSNGTFSYQESDETISGKYYISGDMVIAYASSNRKSVTFTYIPSISAIAGGTFYSKFTYSNLIYN